MWHWLSHWMGLDSGSGPIYLFHSGFGANFGEYALAAGLFALVRKHNCHVRGCLRVGRHKVPGTEFICCAKHTPGGAPTHAHILALHREHQARTGATGERLHDPGKDATTEGTTP